MSTTSELRYSTQSEPVTARRLSWIHELGWKFPTFVLVGFIGVSVLVSTPFGIKGWEQVVVVLGAPALLVLLIFGARQARTGLAELRDNLTWWHGLWFLILISSLVFRIRDAAEAQSLPVDGYALLRLGPEAIVGFYLLVRFLRKGAILQRSLWQGLTGALGIYGIVCLLSASWSVKSTWTLYKSSEFMLDLAVLVAVLVTVESAEAYRHFFNWTLVLCGLELVWTWMGAAIWPQEALHSTYPERLVGVFPIQSANAIGASGAVLSIVAFCRLASFRGCKFGRAWNVLLLCFGLVSILACRTRASLVGFAFAVVVVMLFSRRAQVAAFAGLGVLLALYTAALMFNAAPGPGAVWNEVRHPSGVFVDFLERGQSRDQIESLTGRMEWWHLALAQFVKHPVTGLGAYAGGKFGVLSKSGLGETPQLHSDYLETLVGTSIWGIVPLLSALFGTWWLLIRFVRDRSLRPLERQLALEAIAVLAVITVRSLVNVELIWHAPQFFLAVLGYAELLRRRAKAARLTFVPIFERDQLPTPAGSRV